MTEKDEETSEEEKERKEMMDHILCSFHWDPEEEEEEKTAPDPDDLKFLEILTSTYRSLVVLRKLHFIDPDELSELVLEIEKAEQAWKYDFKTALSLVRNVQNFLQNRLELLGI